MAGVKKCCSVFLRFFILFLLLGVILFTGSGAAMEGVSKLFPAPLAFRQVAAQPERNSPQLDVPPQENILFPLRRIFEEMGYEVYWEVESKRIVLTGWGRYIVLYPQNPLYSINGVVHRMAVLPFIEKGRLMVGLEFIRQAAGVSNLFWDEKNDILEIRFKEGGRFWSPEDVTGQNGFEEYPTCFLEVLLPEENRVSIGESFEIKIGAPFVPGIHSYEVRFFYNPELIKVKDIKNPSYRKSEEFYMKRINNREGLVEYTQTNLGFDGDIPPRGTLVVLEAIAFREGSLPLIKGTLHITVMDNRAMKIPVAVEEKTLNIRSSR